MTAFLLIFAAFYNAILWPSHVNIIAHDPNAKRPFLSSVSQDDPEMSVDKLHRKVLGATPSRLKILEERTLQFETRKVNIDGQRFTRSIPIIDGLAVEGADGIYQGNEYQNQFHYTKFDNPKGVFLLSAAEGMEKAMGYHGASTIQNPYVEKTDGLYDTIWLMHFGELRPAYKVRLPTISVYELKDIYVDAENGEILKIEDAAQFVNAPSNLFVYSPRSAHLSESELKTVSLKHLVNIEEDGLLRGEYMSVKTCCKYFSCPSEGECTDENKKCALRSHETAQQRRELLELPTQSLGLDALVSMPPTVSVDTVRCTYLPFARASFKDDATKILGFYDKPIDNLGPESEMDRFSEIQAYFSMMSFFNNIRSLLNDNTWCLRKEAMSCNSDGSPVLDEAGNPKNPYRVFVNQLVPDMKLQGSLQNNPENFLNQYLAGKGTRDNPIQLNHFARIGNAAFIPALSTLKKNTPRADEYLSDLIKPFDHNVFFQGERDFAYDGDVVFHEFMHAITASLVNKINSLGLDEWGIHSEPGSLNEGWSDYFSAAFTEDPAIGEYASVKGGYGEVSLRNINTNVSCPNDIIGEIHNDGQIWSSALWEIRSVVKKAHGPVVAKDFDRAVLASLAEAKATENFKTQSEKVINNIRLKNSLGEKVADIAEQVFKKRGIRDCFRAFTLSSVNRENEVSTKAKNLLFVPSRNQIGLKNYAPSTSQFEIGIPAGATAVTISWKQFLGGSGALLGAETTPETTKNIEPLGLVLSYHDPIAWKFQNAESKPTRKGEPLAVSSQHAQYKNGLWQITIPLELQRCEQRTAYVSLLSKDFKYVLENIKVSFNMDQSDNRSDCEFVGSIRGSIAQDVPEGCGMHNANHGIIFLLLGLWLCRRRFRSSVI